MLNCVQHVLNYEMVRGIVPLNNEVSYEVQWIIINWFANFLMGGGGGCGPARLHGRDTGHFTK